MEDTSFAKYLNLTEITTGKPFREENGVRKVEEEEGLRHCLIASLNNDSLNFGQAMETREKNYWKKAVREEIDSMIKNKVWKLVDRNKLQSERKKKRIS